MVGGFTPPILFFHAPVPAHLLPFPLQADDGLPEYPANLQESLRQKLDEPAEEVLKIEPGLRQ